MTAVPRTGSAAFLWAASWGFWLVLLAQQAFRDLGHVAAALDPLGLEVPRPPADLHPEYHGLGEAELCHPVVGGRKVSRPTPSFPIRR